MAYPTAGRELAGRRSAIGPKIALPAGSTLSPGSAAKPASSAAAPGAKVAAEAAAARPKSAAPSATAASARRHVRGSAKGIIAAPRPSAATAPAGPAEPSHIAHAAVHCGGLCGLPRQKQFLQLRADDFPFFVGGTKYGLQIGHRIAALSPRPAETARPALHPRTPLHARSARPTGSTWRSCSPPGGWRSPGRSPTAVGR